MNYHNITKDDMLNGEGLRVVLWVAGCSHHCKGCHNPQTWDASGGIPFDDAAFDELFSYLDNDWISGLTLSGGDPLNENNLEEVLNIVKFFREKYKNTKNIWIYSGYTLKQIHAETSDANMLRRKEILSYCDVFVDGRFEEEKKDIAYPWAGSTNQKVIRLNEREEE